MSPGVSSVVNESAGRQTRRASMRARHHLRERCNTSIDDNCTTHEHREVAKFSCTSFNEYTTSARFAMEKIIEIRARELDLNTLKISSNALRETCRRQHARHRLRVRARVAHRRFRGLQLMSPTIGERGSCGSTDRAGGCTVDGLRQAAPGLASGVEQGFGAGPRSFTVTCVEASSCGVQLTPLSDFVSISAPGRPSKPGSGAISARLSRSVDELL